MSLHQKLASARCDSKQSFVRQALLFSISLKVPNVEFNFGVSVRHSLLSAHTSKSNSMLGTNLYAMIRTHHFDFDLRVLPISARMTKTLHQS